MKYFVSFCFLFNFIQLVHTQHNNASQIVKYFEGGNALHLKYIGGDDVYETKVFDMPHNVNQALVISDKNGDYLGYFNGHQVRNADGSLAVNGDSLGYTRSLGIEFIFAKGAIGYNDGFGCKGNSMVLPTKNDSIFLIFYLDYVSLYDVDNFYLPYMLEAGKYEFTIYAKSLLMSEVKVTQGGKLEVNENKRDVVIVEDFLSSHELLATRHGNGEDWWIVVPCLTSDDAYSILVSDNEVKVSGKYPFSWTNGEFFNLGLGTSKFSQKGNKIVRLIYRWQFVERPQILEILDFDRCGGRVINEVSVDSFYLGERYGVNMSAEFSATERFLYLGSFMHFMRIDLNKGDYMENIDTILVMPDTFINSWFETYDTFDHYDYMNILPDGKLILNSRWVTEFFHIVDHPDAENIDLIGYRSRAIKLPEDPKRPGQNIKTSEMPRFIHGDSPTLNCATSVLDDTYYNNIMVYPNPTAEWIYFDKSVGISSFGDFAIYNLTGRLEVIKGEYSEYKINVSCLPSGMYGIKLSNSNKIIKFIKI